MAKSMIAALFGLAALVLIFFKLPGVAVCIGLLTCEVCASATPWIPLLGAAYFSTLIAVIFLFPNFPKCPWRYVGIVWALALPVLLYSLEPRWCTICFFAHLCHLGLWTFWRRREKSVPLPLRIKILLIVVSASAMTALYAALNLTLLRF
ncbi:hypothetical protein [Simkania sp.]|uniref:hypothetical protein n=1 Tax=Simkania sp. TaxID=34094 RepID=UPI003B5303AA